MSIQLRPGMRVFGAACSTELMVVKAPPTPVDLRVGGLPVVTAAGDRRSDAEVTTPADAAPQVGKRYVDAGGTLAVLCTKPGQGAVGVGGALLAQKGSTPLPASD